MIVGACVPGLAMAARELPEIPGVVALENPEVGAGVQLDHDYVLEEVAELHLATLERAGLGPGATLVGYSMGGMILSVLATRFRSRLPADTKFFFLMTSANPMASVASSDPRSGPRVATVRTGTEEEWSQVLAPYFAPEFLVRSPRSFSAYVRYRALGLNGQTPRALFRQLFAMRRFKAEPYFKQLDGREATFIGSSRDRIFGSEHNAELRRLAPSARHVELDDVGHMVHHERPELFREIFRESSRSLRVA